MNIITNTIITANLQAQFDGIEVLPLDIIGSRGTGKTSSIKQISADLGAAFLNVSLPSKGIEYYSGLPNFIEAPHMAKYSEDGSTPTGTEWTVPDLIVSANKLAESNGKCVILLDDFHKLTKSTSAVMYEFLLERKLGKFKLHPQVAIICAQNFSEESGTNVLEEPIKDRLSLLKVEFDYDYWFDNFGKYLHYYVSSFIKAHSQFVLEDESVTLESNASPRSLHYFSNSLSTYDSKFISENAKLLASQYMSLNASEEFAKHVAYMDAIDFTSVVKSRRIEDISKLSILDEILWSYIINYVDEPLDAVYIINLINANMESKSFIGYVISELFIKFTMKEAGKPITKAQDILINKLLGTYEYYSVPEKLREELSAANFADQDAIQELANNYIM